MRGAEENRVLKRRRLRERRRRLPHIYVYIFVQTAQYSCLLVRRLGALAMGKKRESEIAMVSTHVTRATMLCFDSKNRRLFLLKVSRNIMYNFNASLYARTL